MKGFWQSRFLWVFLWPFSMLYRLAIVIRNACYDAGVFRTTRLDVRVISVGNVTVGGTGKTPLVVSLAERLKENGRKVAVLSRGYGRKTKGVVVVSDGHRMLASPEESGDEPYLLAGRLRDVPVVVGESRVAAGRTAIDRYGCDVFVLDDAFQHRSIFRDVDLVVMDANRPWGNGQLLPAGPLREPLSSLDRAHGIVLTHAGQLDPRDARLARIRKWTRAPFLFASHDPVGWVDLKDGTERPMGILNGKRVVAFAGIGNPSSFRKTLESAGVQTEHFLEFGDHHWYGDADIRRIQRSADEYGVDAVVLTEKDAVRLPVSVSWGKPVYYLKIRIKITSGKEFLEDFLRFTSV